MHDDIDTQPGIASWRDVLPIHPAAELFPRMSEAELTALAEDIKAYGLKSPIVLWVPGSPDDEPEPPRSVLDGISRLDAMERAGLQLVAEQDEPTDPFTDLFYACTKTKYASDTDPFAFVVSANLHRRHLTAGQKRDLIAKLLKAQPDASDRQIAATVKASPTTVGTVRSEMEATGDVSKLDTRRDAKGRRQPARKAATKPQRAPAATVPTRDNIGPTSAGEVARLQARIEELHRQLAMKDQRIATLEREVAEAEQRILELTGLLPAANEQRPPPTTTASAFPVSSGGFNEGTRD